MQSSILILFTANFPYGKSEAYLETEIEFLSKSFDKIQLYCNPVTDQKVRKVPSNVEINHYFYLPSKNEKIKSLWGLLSLQFWKELFFLVGKNFLAPTTTRIFSILGTMYTGKKIARFVSSAIKESGVPYNRISTYSYWCNDVALGLALIKNEYPEIYCMSRAHGYDVYFERNKIKYLSFRQEIFKKLDLVSFVSQNGFEYACNKSGKWPSMGVSYLGSTSIGINPKAQQTSYEFQILSCSAVIPLKRVDLILEAIQKLSSKIKVKWIHIGDGPQLEMLKKRATYNSIFFMGQVSNVELLKLYESNHFDVFVNVSTSEGLPFSIIEAFSAGIPAIATAVGGTGEIVQDQENGYLIPETITSTELAEKLNEFYLLSPERKSELQLAAWETWRTKFNAQTNYPNFISNFPNATPLSSPV